MQIENFTDETPIAIDQDFYATTYLANMVALAKKYANQVIEEETSLMKYNYIFLVPKIRNLLLLSITALVKKSPYLYRLYDITPGVISI